MDYVCEKLNEKQVEYINLANWNWIQPGFVGSAVISAVYWEHDVITGIPVFGSQNPQIPILLRNVVGLAAVKVERVVPGGAPAAGDVTAASEGFPIPPGFDFEGYIPQCPGVPTSCAPEYLVITICPPYGLDYAEGDGGIFGVPPILVTDEENPATVLFWAGNGHPSNGIVDISRLPDGRLQYVVAPASSSNAVVGIGADGIISGHRYRIRIGDFEHNPPLTTDFLGYYIADWNGYSAKIPGIDTVILVPCQSGAAVGLPSQPAVYSVSLAPPAGVIEGYEFVGAEPAGVLIGQTPDGDQFWSGAPLNPNAGVYVALWLAPTASNQSGTFLQATRTNTEGYFHFDNVNPCLVYELKFVSDINGNATAGVIPAILATVDGQKYMVSVDAGIYGPGPRPLVH
ncbi:MAG: hypothetical protein U0822_16295 [Anaerolineae bacterium]